MKAEDIKKMVDELQKELKELGFSKEAEETEQLLEKIKQFVKTSTDTILDILDRNISTYAFMKIIVLKQTFTEKDLELFSKFRQAKQTRDPKLIEELCHEVDNLLDELNQALKVKKP